LNIREGLTWREIAVKGVIMSIPYARQSISEEDIKEVVEVLKSNIITDGPKVAEFEKKFSDYVGAKYAVAVSTGTSGLHLAALVAGIKEGTELITSPMTFTASAGCALFCGGKPVFCDIDGQGLIDPAKLGMKITEKTKAIIPVHYMGLPCNMSDIKKIANKHKLIIIEDACHALGARYLDSRIGDCKYSDMAVFSFHPVKLITTGEGGMITTNSKELYDRLLRLRNHGMIKNPEKMISKNEGPWFYEIPEFGYNYRITDFQCALGMSQLIKVDGFIKRRREIAAKYQAAFKGNKNIELITENPGQLNSYHLFVIKVKDKETRLSLFNHLKKNGIHCQVHYIPVYWHGCYEKRGYKRGLCKNAESFYERIISIPMYPGLTDDEQNSVIKVIGDFFEKK